MNTPVGMKRAAFTPDDDITLQKHIPASVLSYLELQQWNMQADYPRFNNSITFVAGEQYVLLSRGA